MMTIRVRPSSRISSSAAASTLRILASSSTVISPCWISCRSTSRASTAISLMLMSVGRSAVMVRCLLDVVDVLLDGAYSLPGEGDNVLVPRPVEQVDVGALIGGLRLAHVGLHVHAVVAVVVDEEIQPELGGLDSLGACKRQGLVRDGVLLEPPHGVLADEPAVADEAARGDQVYLEAVEDQRPQRPCGFLVRSVLQVEFPLHRADVQSLQPVLLRAAVLLVRPPAGRLHVVGDPGLDAGLVHPGIPRGQDVVDVEADLEG